MSTRGAYGFRINSTDKVTYNHSDSYLSYLGQNIINFVKENSDTRLRELAKKIVLVDEDRKPTKKQIGECMEWYDSTVNTRKSNNWYNLLRNAQGDLNVYKKGLKYMIDGSSFLSDSLFCEYTYIINMDSLELEIYRGLNKSPGAPGRYSRCKPSGYGEKYYGVRLFRTIPLDEVRKTGPGWIEKLDSELSAEEELEDA